MKHAIAAFCLVVAVSARAEADLRYTLHFELKQTAADASAASNPLIGMIAAGMVRQVLPNGSADVVYTIGETGSRAEFVHAVMGNPAGTVVLATADGGLLVLNPAAHTYWKADPKVAAEGLQASGAAPAITSHRTGEVETIAGMRCERVTFDWKMDLPIPANARSSLPPDFPSTINMTGDGCSTTGAFQKYTEMARKSVPSGMMSMLGMDKVMPPGIVLRQNVKLFGIELQSIVTEIAEVDAAPGLFALPEGYKEVPAPGGGSAK